MAPRLLTILTAKIVPVALLPFLALVTIPAESATSNPFHQLNGYWIGSGTVTPSKGQAEGVRLPRHLRLIYRQSGELSHAGEAFLEVARANEQQVA